MYTTGNQRYIGGESSMNGRVYANILIGHAKVLASIIHRPQKILR